MKKLLTICALAGSLSAFGQQYCILEAAQKQGILSSSWGKVLWMPVQMGSKKVQIPDSCQSLSQGLDYIASLGYHVIAVNNSMEGNLSVMMYTFEKNGKKE